MSKPNIDPFLTVGDGNRNSHNILVFLIKFYRRSPALMVLHLTGALIAWFAPDDALTRWPMLKVVVTSVAEVFPLVHKAVERSLFPDVTALYFSLMLALTPLRIFEGLRLCYAEKERIAAGYIGFSRKRRVAAFCGALFFGAAVYFFDFLWPIYRLEFRFGGGVKILAWCYWSVVCGWIFGYLFRHGRCGDAFFVVLRNL